jgi:hypothetical protein
MAMCDRRRTAPARHRPPWKRAVLGQVRVHVGDEEHTGTCASADCRGPHGVDEQRPQRGEDRCDQWGLVAAEQFVQSAVDPLDVPQYQRLGVDIAAAVEHRPAAGASTVREERVHLRLPFSADR